MGRDEWIAAFAAQAGLRPPSPEQIEGILELAGTAAHASERTAAPVAAWLAGRSDRPLSELNEAARLISG